MTQTHSDSSCTQSSPFVKNSIEISPVQFSQQTPLCGVRPSGKANHTWRCKANWPRHVQIKFNTFNQTRAAYGRLWPIGRPTLRGRAFRCSAPVLALASPAASGLLVAALLCLILADTWPQLLPSFSGLVVIAP